MDATSSIDVRFIIIPDSWPIRILYVPNVPNLPTKKAEWGIYLLMGFLRESSDRSYNEKCLTPGVLGHLDSKGAQRTNLWSIIALESDFYAYNNI